MLEQKQHLTMVLEVLEWENLNVAQWKHWSSIETLLKPFALPMNVTSSSFSSSFKQLNCVVLVEVLIQSCLFV